MDSRRKQLVLFLAFGGLGILLIIGFIWWGGRDAGEEVDTSLPTPSAEEVERIIEREGVLANDTEYRRELASYYVEVRQLIDEEDKEGALELLRAMQGLAERWGDDFVGGFSAGLIDEVKEALSESVAAVLADNFVLASERMRIFQPFVEQDL